MTAIEVQPLLLTGDVDRLHRFYADLLGATELQRVPEDGEVFFLGLRLGACRLGLVANSEAAANAGQQRTIISVSVDDVDALVERVAPAGGTVTGGPNDMPWGQRVLHLSDPDGNLVNLTQQL